MKKNTHIIKSFISLVFLLSSLFGTAQIAQRGVATLGTSGNTSLTISKPTGVAVNDIMIANISQSDDTSNLSTNASSSGWTLIDGRNLGTNNTRGNVLYKIATAADTSITTYTFTLSTGTDSSTGAIIAFSGVDPLTPFDVTPVVINATNAASLTATGITTATANAAVIMLGQVGDDRSYSNWNTTSPGVLTELYDRTNTLGFDSSVGGAWLIKPTAGATGNGTATLSGTFQNGSILLGLKKLLAPSISGIESTSGCIGGSITINGSNFGGVLASSLTIGGTAVSSITSNNGTKIVAVIGAGTTSGLISVTNSAGTSTTASPFTVYSTPPVQPSTISGNTLICQGSSQTYSVTNVSGTTYTWTFPVGWTVTAGAGTNTVTVTVGSGSGNIQVTPSNGCGNGTVRTLATTSYLAVPAQPSTITGNNTTCIGAGRTYSVTNVPGTTYTWTFPAGWTQTGGTTTNAVTVTVTATSGDITVTPSNGCGNGTPRTLAVTPTPAVPAQPSSITGVSTPCVGAGKIYSVTNVPGTTYTWTFPSGWTVTAGAGTSSVTVTVTASSGNINVTPSNSCGNGTVRTLAVIAASAVPAQPSTITGVTTPCVGTSRIYSVTNVAGTAYAWTFPADWTVTAGAGTSSVTVTVGATSGNVQVTPSNGCGNGTVRTLAVTTISAVPAQPSSITGNTTTCIGAGRIFSVTNVPGTTYTWTFPAGWTQTGGTTTNSVTVTVTATSGDITVTPSNNCGNGTPRTLTVTPTLAVPAQPSVITGNNAVCNLSTQIYSVTNVSGTTYTWTFPAGWAVTAGAGTSSITVTAGTGSGNIQVTPSNSCGNGTVRTLAVTSASTVPAQPSIISGITFPCEGTSRTYSVTNTAGVTYNWVFPAGWTQTAGGTTNSVTVTVGATSGNVQVTPSNGCGNGTARTLAVTPTPVVPPQPSTITGNTTICIGTGRTFSVTNVPGTTYTWTFPAGWTQTGGTTTNAVTVTVTATSGDITVTPSNNCGNGTPRTLTVTPTPAVPAQPSVISGNTPICIGSSQMYSVTNVPGTTYAWTFPGGWTVTAGAGTNSVTVTVGAGSGNIQVTPSNSCGNGTARTLAVTSNSSVPPQPSIISGITFPCEGTSRTYSVTNTAGVTYNWVFPAGWTQTAGGTTNSVTVTVGATSGNVQVTPSNGCGNGTARTLAVTTTSAVPDQPSSINGNSTLCSGHSQTFSVTNVPGTTYAWTFPSDWTQTAGGTTNSVTVTVGSTSGDITVTPTNNCGTGLANTLTTVVNISPTITSTVPGSRIGAGTVDISATASAGTISWFASLTGGTALGTGASFTTPGLVFTTTYYVETNDGSCSSIPRVPVIATINFAEISLSGNGNNILDEDNSPITTDYTNLGTSGIGINLIRTYTIQNSGNVNLTLGTLTISGANASEFTVTAAPASTIASGGSTTFSITFNPTALGIRTADISFITNDPDENPFNFQIAGVGSTGFDPEINLKGNGVTIIDGDSGAQGADHTNFGTATIPGSVVRTFTIENTGTGPLALTNSPMVTITGSSYFTVTSQPSTNTIAAGASLTFQVTFTPALTGSSVAIISIKNDDDDENDYDFVITGTGVVSGKEIDIQGNDVSILDGDTTPSVTDQTDFGITDELTPIALTYNTFSFGTTSLSVTSTITITGPDAAMFSASTLQTGLGPGAVDSFVITFTPSTVLGVKTATITITSDDPDEGSYNFDVKAEIQSLAPLTVAPGGITTNLKFWLKADSNIGITSDNTDITSWQDQTYGGTKNATSKFSKEPKFQNNPNYNVNFNPVIHFNGSNSMTGGQGFNNADMFIVVKPTRDIRYTTSPMDVYCGDDTTVNKNSQDVTGFEMGNTSARHANELIAYNQAANSSYGVAEISTNKFYSGVNMFNPRKNQDFPTVLMDILHNGNTLTTSSANTSTYRDIINSRYWLGRSEFFDASYDGSILEIINYDTRNSDTDKRKIETYLAIKYGITLGFNGTSLDYLNSDGSIIYDENVGFNYNIAGIGRDDKSQLNQKQSKTENTNSDITIGLGTIFDINSNNTNAFDVDKKFLVWGHNNNTLAAQSAITVNMSDGITEGGALTTMVDFIAIGRAWRVKETGGDVPSVKVSIPSNLLTATIDPPGDFYMFISDSPIFSPTAEYRVMRYNGFNLETEFDFTGTKYITFGYAPERTFVRCISFDGNNDYMDAGNVLNLNTSFTVSAWIKRNSTNSTIFSKRDNSFTSGYDFYINSDGKAEMSWINNSKQTITSSVVIPPGIWHNVAVTYDGTTAKLYIDGVLDVTKVMLTVPSNTLSFLVAAADGLNTTSFFNGGIDEVRIWDVALTDRQLRYVMNQEISSNSSLTGGVIIPNSITLNDIKSIPWANLSVYYPMSTYTFTNAKDMSINNHRAAVKNLNTVDRQTAPIPYESAANGSWQTAATWLNNNVQDLPYSLSIVDGITPVSWNIVRTSHNVSSTTNKTVLGLMVNSNTLTANNDTKIEVTNYLKLDGKIDLAGMSQLVQTVDSELDVTSSGSLERDQRGQAVLFNYNYWSSPVSPINSISNNRDYTIDGLLKDGTNPANPVNINWVPVLNGAPTSPISLSTRWLYKFDNYSNAYANWSKITPTSQLRVGQGFTMKGSGAASGSQNLTFVGKPNNGTITTNSVGADQLILIGNPYPSALNATQFINDNINTIDGTIYMWEHYSSNNTHVLTQYQGGYATRNLVGGIMASSSNVDYISKLGTPSRGIPNQYIPVGQGFFVTGKPGSGGIINFNNGQRSFQKENSATTSNSLFRTSNNSKKTTNIEPENNQNDPVALDLNKKIRIGFTSNDLYHKQLLLGFIDGKATKGLDYGYDAINFDDIPNDVYFLIGEKQLVIQGDGSFEAESFYPIGVKTDAEGKVSFIVDELENFENNQEVYIYDSENDSYHDIRNEKFELNLPKGTNNTRFSLRFKNNKSLSLEESILDKEIAIKYIKEENLLVINNNQLDTSVEKVTIYNLLGQNIATMKVENQDQKNIQIPFKNSITGVYIAKIKTSNGNISKKFIIN